MPQVPDIRIDRQSRNHLDHQSSASGRFHDALTVVCKWQKASVTVKLRITNFEILKSSSNGQPSKSMDDSSIGPRMSQSSANTTNRFRIASDSSLPPPTQKDKTQRSPQSRWKLKLVKNIGAFTNQKERKKRASDSKSPPKSVMGLFWVFGLILKFIFENSF